MDRVNGVSQARMAIPTVSWVLRRLSALRTRGVGLGSLHRRSAIFGGLLTPLPSHGGFHAREFEKSAEIEVSFWSCPLPRRPARVRKDSVLRALTQCKFVSECQR